MDIFGVPGDRRPGRELYSIECHQDNFEDDRFDWLHGFECRLIPVYMTERRYTTLFNEEPIQASVWWDGRAVFYGFDLAGKCADYPEYGALRHFRLRGMRITMEVSNIKWRTEPRTIDPPGYPDMQSFDFRIKVEPDRTAQSRITARPEFKEPPSLQPGSKDSWKPDCSTVLRRSSK